MFVFMYSSRYSFQNLIKLEIYGQVFEKIFQYFVLKIRPVEAELFHADGQSDGQT